MSSRFDYVAYDKDAMIQQLSLKKAFQIVEGMVDNLAGGRARSIVYTKLEEAYMWCGKAIRDEQLSRNGSAPLQEERNNE